MKIAFKKFTRSLLLFSVITLLFTGSSLAQEEKVDKGITVSPLIYEYDVDPGDVISGEIVYSNSTLSDKTLYLYIENFESDGVSGAPSFYTDEKPYETSLKDWIDLSRDSFFVEKVEDSEDKSVTITFTITVPNNAEPGGHYAGIISTLNNPDGGIDIEAGNLAFSSDQGTLILLNVSGDVERNINIDKFYATNPFSAEKKKQTLFEWMPVELVTELNNTGNSHTTPIGTLSIYKGDTKLEEIKFNESSGRILRDSTRSYSESFAEGFLQYSAVLDSNDNPVTKDNGDVDKRLTFQSGNGLFSFGKYRAELVIGYQDGNEYKSVSAETSFWVIPWKLILLLIAIIAGTIWYKTRNRDK